jgi:ATP-dependent DNA helicase RecQ
VPNATRPSRRSQPTRRELERSLREELGFRRLRPGQEEVVRSVLAGRDTLAVMPTGAGKSLCYQLPGLHLEGTTVVVSPLISLMKDQRDKLVEMGRVARRLDSTVTASEEAAIHDELAAGEVEFLFVTPERLATAELRRRLRELTIDFVVIDEAHCVSQWGHDFRPDYLELGSALTALGRPPFLALTATAGDEVVADLRQLLGSPDLAVFQAGLYRDNLDLVVVPARGDDGKRPHVEAALRGATGGTGIVYVATVRHCDELSDYLATQGFRVAAYHGRLPKKAREAAQDRFMAGELDAVVATTAFGMGIDKQDIRFVLHHDLPASPEAYYQEAGRAGRDGEPAVCTLLYDRADVKVQKWLLASGAPRGEDVPRLWCALPATGDADLRTLATAVGLSERRARAAAGALARLRLARRSRGRYRRSGEDLDAATLARLEREYAERQEADRERLARIERYAQTSLCRWAFLLESFETDAAAAVDTHCGHCDNCAARRSADLPREVEAPVADVEPVTPALLPGEDGDGLAPGVRVAVPLYGEGTVEELDAGAGVAVVRFRDGATRRFRAG